MVHSSRLVTALCAFSYLAASGADGTWKAREGIGTGGTNLAVWNEVANWVDDTVASGSDAVATLTPAAGRYVKLPDSLSLKTILNDAADAPVPTAPFPAEDAPAEEAPAQDAPET